MDNSPLTPIGENVARKRYYKKDDDGNFKEDWSGLCHRVVNHVCTKESKAFKERMHDAMCRTLFLPNSPCLVNSGTKIGGLMACFTLPPVADSWIGMCENIANFGHVARRGGGVGVNFSEIRPEGDPVFGSTHAKACGPIQHMRVVSEAMASITQAGFRSMANMGVLRVDHPDIMKFIVCKQRRNALRSLLKEDIFNYFEQMDGATDEHTNAILDKFLSNFNISVLVTDHFMQCIEEGKDIELVFGGKVYSTIPAREIFDTIADNAWKNGDPGLLFFDTINNNSPYRFSGQVITTTNPCGEKPMPSYASCNLGSIDVSKFVIDGKIDWTALRDIIRLTVPFLDNVIDKNKFPTKEFANWAKDNRPIGLGIMGWADMLLKLKLAYGSPTSLVLAKKLTKFFSDEAHKKSVELGRERGTPKSCQHKDLGHRRNVTLLSIAPTGSISLLAGCSSSIEPIFAPVTIRNDNTGEYKMLHPAANESYFRCAVGGNDENRVTWQEHIEMQAAFQTYIDSSISKTINMGNDATVDDVAQAYKMAWSKGTKGITIYRDGCKTTQVLSTEKKGVVGYNMALHRPKDLLCDIFKSRAHGFDWHIIVGLLNGSPYEIFALNGAVDLPNSGVVVKKKKRYYSLLDHNCNILVENLADAEKEIDPRICLETRRFSLELRHQINPRYICEQIDKSNDVVTSFSKAVNRIMKKYYISVSEISGEICEKCAKKGQFIELIPESGCWRCPVCYLSRCG